MKKTVNCQFCGKETPMTRTRMCNNCWEVESRIYNMPDVVLQEIIRFSRDQIWIRKI